MNVSLIYPTVARVKGEQSSRRCWPPLGLAYLASVLEKNGHNVQIVDRFILQERTGYNISQTNRLTIQCISDFKTELVGISSTTPDMPDTMKVFELIKDYNPSIINVLGGAHATAVPQETMARCSAIDICVVGEGEKTISAIAQRQRLEQTLGIFYRQGTKIANTAPRPLIQDLDEIPFPAWHLLDMAFYIRPSRFISRNSFKKAASMFTSRGCPFKCNFCAGPLMFPGVRYHSAERVVDEVEKLIKDFSVEAIYFADDMFLASRKRTYEILSLFESRGIYKKIKWYAQIRAGAVDKELLTFMKKMGCDRVEFGFESGSQRVLKLMNKKSTVEQNLKAAIAAKCAAMPFQGNFIIGYPGETEQDLLETAKFMKKTRPTVILFNIFWPLPSTTSYAELEKEEQPLPSWEDTDNATKTGLNYSAMTNERFFALYKQIKFRIVFLNNVYYLIKDTLFHPLVLLMLFREHALEYLKKNIKLVAGMRSFRARPLGRTGGIQHRKEL